MVKLTYVVGAHWNCLSIHFQCEPTTYVTEIKETYFEIYIYQEPCPLTHLNLPIKIIIPVTIFS